MLLYGCHHWTVYKRADMPKFMASVVETDICIVGISKAPSWKTQKKKLRFYQSWTRPHFWRCAKPVRSLNVPGSGFSCFFFKKILADAYPMHTDELYRDMFRWNDHDKLWWRGSGWLQDTFAIEGRWRNAAAEKNADGQSSWQSPKMNMCSKSSFGNSHVYSISFRALDSCKDAHGPRETECQSQS